MPHVVCFTRWEITSVAGFKFTASKKTKRQKTLTWFALLGHRTTNSWEKKNLDVPFTSLCVFRHARHVPLNGLNTCDLSAEIYERLGLSQSSFPSRFLFLQTPNNLRPLQPSCLISISHRWHKAALNLRFRHYHPDHDSYCSAFSRSKSDRVEKP